MAERIANGQTNKVVTGAGRTTGQIVFANVFTLFNLIVGALFVLMVIVGPLQDAVFGLVAIANTLIGIDPGAPGQALAGAARADRAADRAASRDGADRPSCSRRTSCSTTSCELSSGTQAVVDGTVIEADALEIDESLLTGESDPVVKQPGDQVMSGSFAVAGSGADARDGRRRRRLRRQARRRRPAASSWSTARSVSDINHVLKLITWAMIPISILLAVTPAARQRDFDATPSAAPSPGSSP